MGDVAQGLTRHDGTRWNVDGDPNRPNTISVRQLSDGKDGGPAMYEINRNGQKTNATRAELEGLTIRGGAQGDTIDVDAGLSGVRVFGQGGNDSITNRSDGAYIDGGDGFDAIHNSGNNVLVARDARDTVTDQFGGARTIDPDLRGQSCGNLQGACDGRLTNPNGLRLGNNPWSYPNGQLRLPHQDQRRPQPQPPNNNQNRQPAPPNNQNRPPPANNTQTRPLPTRDPQRTPQQNPFEQRRRTPPR